MWEPFTERARRSISKAGERAHCEGNAYISTRHLLMGLLEEGESLASKILVEIGVNIKDLTKDYLVLDASPRETVFTPRAKELISRAFEEARAMAHNYIGTEHLLLAGLNDPKSEFVEHLKAKHSHIDIEELIDEVWCRVGMNRPCKVKDNLLEPEEMDKIFSFIDLGLRSGLYHLIDPMFLHFEEYHDQLKLSLMLLTEPVPKDKLKNRPFFVRKARAHFRYKPKLMVGIHD